MYNRQDKLIAEHHNRIFSIIRNNNNNPLYLKAIRRLINNFESIFGTSKLSNHLLSNYFELYNKLLN